MTRKKQLINDHTLAISITNDEGLKKSVTIAQVKEVLLITRKTLAGSYTVRAVTKWLGKSR